MNGLDIKDWKILEQLCINSRTSHNSIAKEVGLSKNAVTYRVDRLFKIGVIKGFFMVVNSEALGYSFSTILLRLSGKKEREDELIRFLVDSQITMVVDRLVGEWNLLVDCGYKTPLELYDFLYSIQNQFCDILDVFEMHPVLGCYKSEQLPVEFVEERTPSIYSRMAPVILDELDFKLLTLLNKDSTLSLIHLGKELGVTYETVADRIKKLREKKIIITFTAKLDLGSMGYEVYVLRFDLRRLTKEKAESLKEYINLQRNIRYAFLSAHAPVLFVYLAVKNATELDTFLLQTKDKFTDEIVNQRYYFSPENLKYELFPGEHKSPPTKKDKWSNKTNSQTETQVKPKPISSAPELPSTS